MEKQKSPELLSPAGDWPHLQLAVAFGADAVYLASDAFGMRFSAGSFGGGRLREAVDYCRQRNVDVHLVCNTLPRNDELRQLPAFFEEAVQAGVTALIVADLGVFSLAQRYAPGIPLHVSTQAGVVNYESARMWHELGASRVILARELPLTEITELKARCPAGLEVEMFAHGAMCVSFSGRCVLSNYMTGRDANRGQCAQPCRYRYTLMEEKRPGEYFPVFENDQGTFIFNSRDLCTIDYIPALMEAGVDSLKLEGRAKTAYYTAVVTNAYRHAIDAAAAGEPLSPVWRAELDKISHRPYGPGFLFGRRQDSEYSADSRYIRDWQVCAQVVSCTPEGLATLSLNNKFSAGDPVELLAPGMEPMAFDAPLMTDEDGVILREPRHPQMRFRMQLPCPVPPLSLLRKYTGA